MEEELLLTLADSALDQVIAWRRYLHQNPELSYREVKTAQFLYETLSSFGHLEVSRPAKTSVMARLKGTRPGKTVAIRADIDALPIQEENDFPYVSRNPGVMHACGHDTHTAMLLGTAKILSGLREEIAGEVRFIFQHAEELFPPGGAEELVEAGVMDGVDAIIGGHIWAPLEAGKVGLAYGPMMASPDTFTIVIHGKGGHGAMPQQTVDAIVIGAEVVVNLQHIVARNIDPLDSVVVTVGQFLGGVKENIISGGAKIEGTIRTLDPKVREEVPRLMERVVKGITEAHGAAYEFSIIKGYRPVINDERVVRVLEKSVRVVMGEEAVEYVRPNMGGEDFSAYLQKAPGAFFFLGGGSQAKGYIYPHHHSRFIIDESALANGIKIFLHATFALLNSPL
ncbi:N-acyl-L-amino acid amidohydrolase [Peptococcaceae bacterium CEB3]|nr:N-acyl-L-amino acid amidohydrolase [Peptococcaceae bacterium CEB3]